MTTNLQKFNIVGEIKNICCFSKKMLIADAYNSNHLADIVKNDKYKLALYSDDGIHFYINKIFNIKNLMLIALKTWNGKVVHIHYVEYYKGYTELDYSTDKEFPIQIVFQVCCIFIIVTR